jgi:hypothetical protein
MKTKTFPTLLLSLLSVFATAEYPSSLSEDELAELDDLLLDRHSPFSQFQTFVRDRQLSDPEALEGLRFFIEEPQAGSAEIASSKRGKAIWCIRGLHSPEAFDYAERLLETEDEKWPPAIVFREMAFQDESRLPRLFRMMDNSSEPLFRFWIYNSIGDELQTTVPEKKRQALLVRFLLDRSLVETRDASQLDAILCREVPKWRASPQRAENAAKMILEHPDDARLVAFFETVRTNTIESARTARLSEDGDADSPATTNQMTRASVPPADSDPWAGLLDDLPEKKPWTPPPGYEPVR